jgi:hypothetical protein
MSSNRILPEWAPRVPQAKIRQLYQNDAAGIYDDELINEVGYGLLARCKSFIEANEAFHGRVRCPRCSAIVNHSRAKDELLRCACGWELTWGEYFATIQHRQLSGAEPVLNLFSAYVTQFPQARSAQEKVLQIDRLIHGFHWFLRMEYPTRPVAVNLIEGRLVEVIEFLDGLAVGTGSTPGVSERKAEWNQTLESALSRWPNLRGDRSEQHVSPKP